MLKILNQQCGKTLCFCPMLLLVPLLYFSWLSSPWNGYTPLLNLMIPILSSASVLGFCLVVVLCSYLAIWKFKRNEVPGIPIDRRQQNKKLALTLSIVTFLSVLTWLPFLVGIVIIITVPEMGGVKNSLYNIGRLLQLANSSINPIVYYARMPEFRKQLRNMILKQKSHKEKRGRQLSTMQAVKSWLIIAVIHTIAT